MYIGLMTEMSAAAGNYNVVSRSLEEKLGAMINNRSIIMEISNQIILNTIKDNSFEQLHTKSDQIISVALDKYLMELQMYCYRYALQLTSDHEFSQDIVQETIIEMYHKAGEIECVKGWVKGTVRNKVLAAWRKMNKDKNLIAELMKQEEPVDDPITISEEDMESKLPDEQIKELLIPEEYEKLIGMRNYDSLKEYAEDKKISHDMARKQKYMILKNLKAAYLKSIGWLGRSEILSFKRFRNIRLFMKRLILNSNSGTLEKLLRHCSKKESEELKKVISHLKQISDWTISFAEEDCFNLSLADYDDLSAMVYMKIRVPEKGQIKIVSGRLLKCGGIIPNPKKKEVPVLRKGFIGLTIEELIKYNLE
jgi:DNA-directed RNA polymerase specialized sigma24 family protein